MQLCILGLEILQRRLFFTKLGLRNLAAILEESFHVK
jgi:hypothetical protein